MMLLKCSAFRLQRLTVANLHANLLEGYICYLKERTETKGLSGIHVQIEWKIIRQFLRSLNDFLFKCRPPVLI
jgi:hypothetical protein